MPHPKETRARAVELHTSGMRVGDISRELGVHYDTVMWWVNPARRARAAELQRQRLEDPAYRKKQNEHHRKRWKEIISSPQRAEEQRRYRRALYAECPERRARALERAIQYQVRMQATDAVYDIRFKLRCRVRQALKGRAKKAAKTEELIGCSAAWLAERWDAQYGPSWREEHGLHIDHIRPCSSFDLADPDQQRTCFNFRNLQLLPSQDNMSKGSRWTLEDEAAWAWRMRSLGYEGELFLVFLGPRGRRG